MFEIGKSKAKKDGNKLSIAVSKVKQKYNSLSHSSKVANIPWTRFYCCTHFKKQAKHKKEYSCKLTGKQVHDIQLHFESDDISFPMPDKKWKGKDL